MLKRLLIANRGEIACRIAKTARRLGIETVAVYSDADRFALHVKVCDQAIYIGASAASESYLSIEKVIAAARSVDADAIHPGYGFLSESVAFASACAEAGIVFVGPSVHAIAAMGSKSTAKEAVMTVGVPLIPGYLGQSQAPEVLLQEAIKIGFPVMIKAVSGGGGKGMRRVDEANDFLSALHACQREAKKAFGDDAVLLEKYILSPRHVEVQVFADTHGNCVYLGERDCSIQRRHQKIIEEAPAPHLTFEQRSALGEVAIKCAKAVNYVGAGTVEFIFAPDGQFYFMEMNTRLQVEHPVTEMVTGLDLVEWQLRIAAGEHLPLAQDQIQSNGWAIEVRLCAENPAQDFLPAIGKIKHWQLPEALQFERGLQGDDPMIRVDSGVMQGSMVSPYYDSMLAKIICWAKTREQCVTHLLNFLSKVEIVGVKTNLAFLQSVLADDVFKLGRFDTGFLLERSAYLADKPLPNIELLLAALCVARLYEEQPIVKSRRLLAVSAWSNGVGLIKHEKIICQGVVYDFWWQLITTNEAMVIELKVNQIKYQITNIFCVSKARQLPYQFNLNHQSYAANVVLSELGYHVFLGGVTVLLEKFVREDLKIHEANDLVRAPMPGKIIQRLKKEGSDIAVNEPLVILEAMKMEHTICANKVGKIERWHVVEGEQVAEGMQLLDIV